MRELKTIGEAQEAFMECLPALIRQALAMGYKVRGGELWRDQRWAKILAKMGLGIVNSLHIDKLAIDIQLFKDGVWLTSTESHKPLGEWWEDYGKKQGLPLCWGGRFGDGNHYSLSWGGRK